MYGHPKKTSRWAKFMKPKGQPGRPPKYGSEAWMRRKQLSLSLLPSPDQGSLCSGVAHSDSEERAALCALPELFFAGSQDLKKMFAGVVAPRECATGCTVHKKQTSARDSLIDETLNDKHSLEAA